MQKKLRRGGYVSVSLSVELHSVRTVSATVRLPHAQRVGSTQRTCVSMPRRQTIVTLRIQFSCISLSGCPWIAAETPIEPLRLQFRDKLNPTPRKQSRCRVRLIQIKNCAGKRVSTGKRRATYENATR